MKRLSDRGDICSEKRLPNERTVPTFLEYVAGICYVLANGKGRRLRVANIATSGLRDSERNGEEVLAEEVTSIIFSTARTWGG